MDGYALSAGLLGACSNSSTSRVIGSMQEPLPALPLSSAQARCVLAGRAQGGTALMAGKNRPRAVRSDRGCQTRKQLMALDHVETSPFGIILATTGSSCGRASTTSRHAVRHWRRSTARSDPGCIERRSPQTRHAADRVSISERDRMNAPLSAARAVATRPSLQGRPLENRGQMDAGSRPAALAPEPLR
jgi:hypothetical protein